MVARAAGTGHPLPLQHFHLPKLGDNLFGPLSLPGHSMILLKNGINYPIGWTTSAGLLQLCPDLPDLRLVNKVTRQFVLLQRRPVV